MYFIEIVCCSFCALFAVMQMNPSLMGNWLCFVPLSASEYTIQNA